MSLLIGGLYDALKDAGAKDHLARTAAEEVAKYEDRLSKITSDLAVLKGMVGFNLAMTGTLLFKPFN